MEAEFRTMASLKSFVEEAVACCNSLEKTVCSECLTGELLALEKEKQFFLT